MDDFLVVDDVSDAVDDNSQSQLHKLKGHVHSSASTSSDATATAKLTSDLVSRIMIRPVRSDQTSQVYITLHMSTYTIAVLRAVRICANSVRVTTS